MQLNFGKGKHCLPHFYYCSVAKWILQFHSDLSSTLRPGSQMIDYNYCFCNNYFCTCFLHWCAVFPWNDLKQNWGCSMAVPIIKTYKNSNYNGLFGYLMEAKTTVELWESEIRAGPFYNWDLRVVQIFSKKWRGAAMISYLCQVFPPLLCI